MQWTLVQYSRLDYSIRGLRLRSSRVSHVVESRAQNSAGDLRPEIEAYGGDRGGRSLPGDRGIRRESFAGDRGMRRGRQNWDASRSKEVRRSCRALARSPLAPRDRDALGAALHVAVDAQMAVFVEPAGLPQNPHVRYHVVIECDIL